MTHVTRSMLADEVQVLLGSDVWFAHRSCPAATYDPSMLGLLPYEWTDLLGDSPVAGVAAWHDGKWWEVPVRAQATIVRANVYQNGSPRMLPAPPLWWRNHEAVINRLNNP